MSRNKWELGDVLEPTLEEDENRLLENQGKSEPGTGRDLAASGLSWASRNSSFIFEEPPPDSDDASSVSVSIASNFDDSSSSSSSGSEDADGDGDRHHHHHHHHHHHDGDEVHDLSCVKLRRSASWRYTVLHILLGFFPFLRWLPRYPRAWRENLPGDIKAAVTVGILLIPQGLAYALLADLPVQYGLYASFVGPLVYPFFGTSRELSVAPAAVSSLLMSTGLSQLYDPETESEKFIRAAFGLALIVGIIQICMGVLRLGFIVNFLSHSVLSGFTSGAALVIALSQLKHVLGVETPRSTHAHEVLEATFENIESANWRTIVLSVCTMTFLLVWKFMPADLKIWRHVRQLPSAMLAVVFTTVASAQLRLVDDGVDIVGDVPAGLPRAEAATEDYFGRLFVLGLTVALMVYIESMAVAKKFADMRGNRINYNQELVALGMSNAVVSCLQGVTVCGALSRTAVNATAGAKTQIASFGSGIIVLVALLVATSLFHHLPKACLGSIIIVAVIPLIDVVEPFRLWKLKKLEALLLVITFALTAFIGVELGVAISVGLSLLLVVWQSSQPHYAMEGRLGRSQTFKNVKRHPEAEVPMGAAIFRFDANLFFANSAFFERKFQHHCMRSKVSRVVLNFASINDVDAQGLATLRHLLQLAKKRGKTVVFATVKEPVRDLFDRMGFTKEVGEEHFYSTVHDAIAATDPTMNIQVACV